jgi:DNA polymerase
MVDMKTGAAAPVLPRRPGVPDALFLDFETFADAQYSLKKLSHRAYILDDRFDILCLAIAEGDGKVDFYHKRNSDSRSLEQARERIATAAKAGKWLVCHNANFDALILKLRWGVEFEHVFDTSDYLRLLGLWASLHNGALWYGQGKADAPPFTEESLDDPADLAKMAQYNARDVALCRLIFERAVSDPDLSDLEVWVMDKTCRDNLRGTRIDTATARAVSKEYQEQRDEALEQLCGEFTDLDTTNLYSPAQVLKYIKKKFAVKLDSLDRRNLTTAKARKANANLDRFLSLRERIHSWGKWAKVAAGVADRTDRIYGFLRFYGGHTGRFSSGGGQGENLNLQNLPTGRDKAYAALAKMRGIVIPEDDQWFTSADLSAIEARVVAFLAGEHDQVERFRADEDIYIWFGEQAFPGKKIVKGGENDELRGLAKQAILGLGFGMSSDKFYSTLKERLKKPPDRDTASRLFEMYQQLFPRIKVLRKRYWASFTTAVDNGVSSTESRCFFEPLDDKSGRGVVVTLPTGRKLYYRDVRVDEKTWSDGGTSPQYWSSEGFSCAPEKYAGRRRPKRCKKFDDGRVRTTIYGQVLVENIVQATARDILVGQMYLLEEVEGLPVSFHVHDEIVAASPACACPDRDRQRKNGEQIEALHRPDCPWVAARRTLRRIMSAPPPLFEKIRELPVGCEVSDTIGDRYAK